MQRGSAASTPKWEPGRAILLAVMVGLTGSLLQVPGASASDTDLAARWTLDEGSGSTAEDVVGSSDGSMSGANWITTGAAVGAGALAMDGTGRVDVTDAEALKPAEVTLAAWVRGDPNSPPVAGEVIVEKGAFDCAGPEYGLYVTADGISGRYRSAMGHDLVGGISSATAKVDLWDGAWHLVALGIANGDAAMVSIDALAAVLPWEWQAGQTSAIEYQGATDQGLRIGAPLQNGCGRSAFSGDIDDVRVYSTFAAFQAIGDLVPPIPTTTMLDSHATFEFHDQVSVSATVSPLPRLGSVKFEFLVHDTSTVIDTGYGWVQYDGHAAALLWSPSLPGTYDLRATFAGPTYETSSDTEVIEFDPLASTTTVSVAPISPIVTQPIQIAATVTSAAMASNDAPAGSVEFEWTTGGVEQILGSVAVTRTAVGTAKATLELPTGLPLGTGSITARYSGDDIRLGSNSAPWPLTIGVASSFVLMSGPTTVQTHHAVVLNATVGASLGEWADGATVTYASVSGSGPGCVVTATPQNSQPCTINSLPVGTHAYRATYSGNDLVSGSVSDPWTVVVTADTVEATGIGVDRTTFYPYKDGYKDTVSIIGMRNEPISVAITIYGPTGAKVRSTTIARAAGKYVYVWNGRNSSGSLLAAGKYKVIYVLRDAAGTQYTSGIYVTLSRKRIYTYTAYITKTVAQAAKKTASWIGWQFTLPSAAIYKGMWFQAYGRSVLIPGAELGPWDFRGCGLSTTWLTSCVSSWAGMGPTNGWYSKGMTSWNRSGRYVRGIVRATGSAVVYKARIKVVYGILK